MSNQLIDQPSDERWNEHSDANFQFDSILRLVKTGWYRLMFWTIVGWILAGIYFVVAPPRFESQAQLYVMQKDPALAAQGVSSGGKADSSVSEDMLATHIEIIQSRRILERVLDRPQPMSASESGFDQTVSPGSGSDETTSSETVPLEITEDNDGFEPDDASGSNASGSTDEPAREDKPGLKSDGLNSPAGESSDPSTEISSVSLQIESNLDSTTAENELPGNEDGLISPGKMNDSGDIVAANNESLTGPETNPQPGDGNVVLEPRPLIRHLKSIQDQLKEDGNPIKYLIDNLSVTRGGSGQARDAHVLNISFQHSSAHDARIILEALLDEYDVYLKDKFQDVNKDAAVLINQASKELEAELQNAEVEYAEFRQEAPILWNGEGSTNVHQLRYEGLQNEISELSIQLGEAETRLKVVRVALQKQIDDGTPVFDRLALIDEKNAPRLEIMLQVQLGKAESADFQSKQPERMENARVEYQNVMAMMLREKTLIGQFGLGPNHPEIISLRESIDAARQFIDKRSESLDNLDEGEFGPEEILQAYVKLLENDVVTLDERRRQLEELAAVEEVSAKAMIKFELNGTALQSRITRQQDLYNTVVDRLREINIAKDYGGVINDVIAEPEIGEGVWPRLPVCLALGTLLGLFVGGLLTAFSELSNRSFRSAAEVQSSLGVPVMTHLPAMNALRDFKLAAQIRKSKSQVGPMNYVHHMPKSQNAEVFRGLRTSLFFKCTQNQRLICVTSPNQGDGKSTLIANLAASVAQSDRKVLLIDCDMRRPSLHKQFGLNNDCGLVDVLANDRDSHELIQQTEVKNLSALTSGVLPDNPAELLGSAKFAALLNELRGEYEYIMMDCPPVLAVADPAIVAPLSDGTIMLVNVAKDFRGEAIDARETLAGVGAEILGLVVSGGLSLGANNYVGGTSYGNGGRNSAYYSNDS